MERIAPEVSCPVPMWRLDRGCLRHVKRRRRIDGDDCDNAWDVAFQSLSGDLRKQGVID